MPFPRLLFFASLFSCFSVICFGQACIENIVLNGSPFNASIGPFGIAALGGDDDEFTLTVASALLSLEEPYFVTADCDGITSVSYGLNIPSGSLSGNNTCVDSAYGIKALDIAGRSDIYLGITGESRLFLPTNTGQGISDLQTGICYQYSNTGQLVDLASINTTVYLLNRDAFGGDGALCGPDVTFLSPGSSISGACGSVGPSDGKWIAGTLPDNTPMEGPLGIENIPGENFLLVTLASTNGNATSALQKYTPSTRTSIDVTLNTAEGVTAPNVSEIWSDTNFQIGLAGVHYDASTEFLYAYGGDGKVYRMCSNDSWSSAYIDETKDVASPAFVTGDYGASFTLTGDLTTTANGGYDVYIVRPAVATIELIEFSPVVAGTCPPVPSSTELSSSSDGGGGDGDDGNRLFPPFIL